MDYKLNCNNNPNDQNNLKLVPVDSQTRNKFLNRLNRLQITEEEIVRMYMINQKISYDIDNRTLNLFLRSYQLKCNKCNKKLLAINFQDEYKTCNNCKKKQKEYDLVMEVLLGMDI